MRGAPIVIVEVPLDDDPLFPSRVMFYREDTWTGNIKEAKQFDDVKDAQKKANQLMHYGKNVLAFPVPFPIAWALWRATRAPWDKHKEVAYVEPAA